MGPRRTDSGTGARARRRAHRRQRPAGRGTARPRPHRRARLPPRAARRAGRTPGHPWRRHARARRAAPAHLWWLPIHRRQSCCEGATPPARSCAGRDDVAHPRLRLPPGSYLLVIPLTGRPEVRYPLLLERGETLHVSISIPARVPTGFVYVPPGRFLYGSPDEATREEYEAQAEHPVMTGAYLIARHEVTFGDWIEYLEDCPRGTCPPHAAC